MTLNRLPDCSYARELKSNTLIVFFSHWHLFFRSKSSKMLPAELQLHVEKMSSSGNKLEKILGTKRLRTISQSKFTLKFVNIVSRAKSGPEEDRKKIGRR